ncbi:unnamed protein product [Adineta ricciae]|uniref:Uncharacterized protein n=2 Tax=Adineta ricciae TaxID=249248 RepID=A0A814RU53_ADIRI|nr:unnamed protein product [Adineta ricciae]
MVLLQAVVMLFTNIPYIITYLLQASLDLTGYPVILAQVQFAFSVTMSFLYMSFATSFYIYCWASNRFRRQLKYVLFDIHFNRCRERTIGTNQIIPVVA